MKNHPWFLKNLPSKLTEAAEAVYLTRDNKASTHTQQTEDDIWQIVVEARKPPPSYAEEVEMAETKEEEGEEVELLWDIAWEW